MAVSKEHKTPERRTEPRMSLHLPVQVLGHDSAAWVEITTSEDASTGGLAFLLKHAVAMGQVLRVALPLPKHLRRYGDPTQAAYRAYALVRDVDPGRTPTRVGAMFLGEQPPRGFLENPGGRILLPSDPKPAFAVKREAPRFSLTLNVKLRRMDPWGGGPVEELTVTEDISEGGAKVPTSMPITKGEIVDLEQVGGPLVARAVVQCVGIGPDNVPRLSLEFLETTAAEHVKQILRSAGIQS